MEINKRSFILAPIIFTLALLFIFVTSDLNISKASITETGFCRSAENNGTAISEGITSKGNCIKQLTKHFESEGESIFTLKYIFEVTGISGGVGEGL